MDKPLYHRDFVDPLYLSSPTWNQKGSLVKVIQFGNIPFQVGPCKLNTIQVNQCQSGSDPNGTVSNCCRVNAALKSPHNLLFKDLAF